jgi:hypothetical protein
MRIMYRVFVNDGTTNTKSSKSNVGLLWLPRASWSWQVGTKNKGFNLVSYNKREFSGIFNVK